MDKRRLQVKAAIIYLSLLFPDDERHRLLSLLMPDEKAESLIAPDLTIEFLSSYGKVSIENYIDQLNELPNGDQISETVVLSFLDTLFNNKSEIDFVKRSCLLATTLTLCAAYRRAYDNKELGCIIQQAYDVFSLVACTKSIDFTSEDKLFYGSYISIDFLDQKELSQDGIEQPTQNIEEDFLQEQEEQTSSRKDGPCRKFPRFLSMVNGEEIEYLTELYNELSNNIEYCLFTKDSCPIENFLALFEGVPGYEDQAPQRFRAASSLDYWGVFLSAIYSGKRGFELNDGTKLWRGKKSGQDGLSISEFAMNIINDQKGKPAKSPSTFDSGSGGGKILDSSEERKNWTQKYTEVLRKVTNKLLPPSKVRERISNFKNK